MPTGDTGKPSVRKLRPTKIYPDDWDLITDIQINAKQARMPVPTFADIIHQALSKFRPKLYKVPEKKS